jgi:hypothetical protein
MHWARALHGYLGDKFGQWARPRPQQPTSRTAFTAFTNGGTELAASYIELLEACDMARYAPVEDRPRQQLYEQAAELIRRTEQTRTRMKTKALLFFLILRASMGTRHCAVLKPTA